MKNLKTGFYFSLALAAFFVLGCEKTDSTSGKLREAYVYPQNLWGEWIRMDTGATWYIGSNYIAPSGNYDSLSLAKQSDNVIEVTNKDTGSKYYLYASRTADASFTGKIVNLDAAATASVSMGRTAENSWLWYLARNMNGGEETTGQTDGNGNFTVDGAIPGDEYLITPDGGTGTVVTPISDGDDVGTIAISEGVNFKTTVTAPSSTETDMMKLLNGTDYALNIAIQNTGTADCIAATYSLNFPPNLTQVVDPSSPPRDPALGTIEPGKTKTINVKVNCPALAAEHEFRKIGVTVNDPISGKTWEDSVSLKFHRQEVLFEIHSNSRISGIIITPTAKAYPFNTNNTERVAKVSVPWSAEDFLVVFSGATAETEAKYSLGIGIVPSTDFIPFGDLGNYEPNNTEAAATPLVSQGQIMSYLHKNDIDYYRVKLSQ